jgi:chromosome segregation ATPase
MALTAHDLDQIETILAPRISALLTPVVDAVAALQQNQTVIVAAITGLTAAVAELRTGQRTLEASMSEMQRCQRALDVSVRSLAERIASTERLAQLEARFAALEARLATANDRS